jgi:hypothetical protein
MHAQLTGTNAVIEGFMFGPFAVVADYGLSVAEIVSPASFGRMPERVIQKHWRAVCGLLAALGADLLDEPIAVGDRDVFTATF